MWLPLLNIVSWPGAASLMSELVIFFSSGNHKQHDCHGVVERDATLSGFDYLGKSCEECK